MLNNDIEKDFIVLRQIIELLEATKEIKSDKELKVKIQLKVHSYFLILKMGILTRTFSVFI